jgi:hypothetical protein
MTKLRLSIVIHLSISGFHMTKAWAINPTTEVRLTIINHQKHTRNLFDKFLNHHLQYLPKTYMSHSGVMKRGCGFFKPVYGTGYKESRLNIWIKNNSSPIPTVAFNKCTEYCVYGTKGSPYLSDLVKNLNEIQNKDCTTGNQLLEDISNIWATKRLPSNQMEHPTSKNPELHHKFIMRCTKPGDIIFDAFSGSASTMICAEQLGIARCIP